MAPRPHPGLAPATMWRAVTTDVVYRYGKDIVPPRNDPYRAIAGWHIYTDAITRYNLLYAYTTGIIGIFIPGDTFPQQKHPERVVLGAHNTIKITVNHVVVTARHSVAGASPGCGRGGAGRRPPRHKTRGHT